MDELSHLQRWRLILGSDADESGSAHLSGEMLLMDELLEQLYGTPHTRDGGLGASVPQLRRWLSDIHKCFPRRVVHVLQQEAVKRFGVEALLSEPELIDSLVPDVQLAATLLSLKDALSDEALERARCVVARLARSLRERLEFPLVQALIRARRSHERTHRPQPWDIDMDQTIRRNLKHYQPQLRAIIPQIIVGERRKGQALSHLVLLIDQSGSMATSLIYAAVLGSVMAQIRSLRTHFVVFDTQVVDLTDKLSDPVALLFSTQLGGGTDIGQALVYARKLVVQPRETIVVLLSDLYEGGRATRLLREASQLVHAGVRLISLLALSDEGRPAYDRNMARQLAQLGIPAFATTPEVFPELMAAAIKGRDLKAFM